VERSSDCFEGERLLEVWRIRSIISSLRSGDVRIGADGCDMVSTRGGDTSNRSYRPQGLTEVRIVSPSRYRMM
jgi:hypothetical protein